MGVEETRKAPATHSPHPGRKGQGGAAGFRWGLGRAGRTEMRRKVWEQGRQEGMRGEAGDEQHREIRERGERERGVSPKEAAALG